MSIENDSDFMDSMQVCQTAGIGIDTLRDKVRRGLFPAATHRRGRKIFWLRSVVTAAVAGLTRPIGEDRLAHLPAGAEAR